MCMNVLFSCTTYLPGALESQKGCCIPCNWSFDGCEFERHTMVNNLLKAVRPGGAKAENLYLVGP